MTNCVGMELPAEYAALDLSGRLRYVDDLKHDVMQLQYMLSKQREQAPRNPLLNSAQGTVQAIQPLKFKQRQTLKGHKGKILNLRTFTQGSRSVTSLATMGQDGFVVLWDAATGLKFEAFAVSRGNMSSMGVSPTGRIVTTGGLACTIDVFATTVELNDALGDPLKPFRFTSDELGRSSSRPTMALGKQFRITLGAVHDANVSSQAFSDDGHLLSGSEDTTVVLWDIAASRHSTRFTGHTGAVLDISTTSGDVFATTGSESVLKVWDKRTGTASLQYGGRPKSPFEHLQFFPDMCTIAASDGYGMAMFDTRTNGLLQYLPSPGGYLSTFALSKSGRVAVHGFEDGRLEAIDTLRGEYFAKVGAHRDHISGVGIVNNTVYSSSWDGTVREWLLV